ncbi:MAG TPA: hypothetical protein VK694_00985 [Verrucomicrobiae bacterium]|nr:hypothetical protein [Verrucomicrobiae bacterium]
MTRKRILPVALVAAIVAIIALSGCGGKEAHETDRGRGDTTVDHINQGHMDLAVEMGDGFLGIGHKCVGPTGYITSTKGNGGAGALVTPVFMDPYCLGVYDSDGTVNNETLGVYVSYLAAVQGGNTDLASSLAIQLVQNAPSDLTSADPLLR